MKFCICCGINSTASTRSLNISAKENESKNSSTASKPSAPAIQEIAPLIISSTPNTNPLNSPLIAPPIAPTKPPSSHPASAPLTVSQIDMIIINGYAIFDTIFDTAENNVPNEPNLDPIIPKNSIILPRAPFTKDTALPIGPLTSEIVLNPAIIGSKNPVTAVFMVVITLPIIEPSPKIPLKKSIAPVNILPIFPTTFLKIPFMFSTSNMTVTSILNRIVFKDGNHLDKNTTIFSIPTPIPVTKNLTVLTHAVTKPAIVPAATAIIVPIPPRLKSPPLSSFTFSADAPPPLVFSSIFFNRFN